MRMGNLDRGHQMADVNDLESTLLKVCSSFLVELVGEEGTMDQCDSNVRKPAVAAGADMRTGMPFECR
jgi:hypothetical protein